MIMKNYVRINIFILTFALSSSLASSQIIGNGTQATTGGDSPAFINASGRLFSSSNGFTTDGSGNSGKGIAFPRTNLTTFEFQSFLIDYPTYADGLVVFNIGSGTTPSSGSGIGSQEVEPGFYYFSNPGSPFNTNAGEWKPLGSEGSPKIHVTENTPTETNLVTVDTTVEKVISITGTADGITTHMDLGTTVLPKDTVVNFRKAIICDSTGSQVLVATGSYDSATNKFVTGNGMMNYCLPAGNDYKVELYYTSN